MNGPAAPVRVSLVNTAENEDTQPSAYFPIENAFNQFKGEL